MKKLLPKAVAIILCLTSVIGVTTAQTLNCSTIKDGNLRLKCYDASAKQVADDARTSANTTPDKGKTHKQPSAAPIQVERSLQVEAGLIYKSGAVKPVLRTDFYLLDKDLIEIFKNANVALPVDQTESMTKISDALYPEFALKYFAMVQTEGDQQSRSQKLKVFYEQANTAIGPHIVQKQASNFSGKVSFQKLKPGTYYVMSVYKTEQNTFVWNSKVDVTNGDASISLDQSTATSML